MSAVEAAPARIRPVRAVRHGLALGRRSMLKIRNSPEQLMDVVFLPIVLTVLFTFVFGGAVAKDWHTYLEYLAPGLLVQTVLFATMTMGVALSTDIVKGINDRFRSMPIARSGPLVGAMLGEAARYLISIVVLLAFAAVLGFRFHNGLLPGLAGCAVVLVFALTLCWVPALLGLLLKNPQTVQGIGFVVMFPLTLISNVFVRTETMPGWLQAWVRISPVTGLANAARGLMLGGPVAWPLLYSAIWAGVFLLVFAPLAVRAYIRHS